MKKAIALVVTLLLVCATYALATELLDAVSLTGRTLPQRSERTGSCVVQAVPDTASVISIWGATTWYLGDAHASYIDPATDQDANGGCTAPFYPFHITSVDFYFAELSNDTNNVGRTVTYTIQFACPADLASGTVTEDCQGPGTAFATYTLTHTLVREDFDADGFGNIFILNLPVDVCVNRGFFLVARYTAWDGTGAAPQVVWHQQGGALTQANKRCDNWLWLGTALGYQGWILDGYQIGYGCTTPPPGFTACFPGAAYMFVNGNSDDACNPASACAALPNTYPGDDANYPIVVSSPSWNQTINMCNYTSDYNYWDDSQATNLTNQRAFTSNGSDVVLDLTFDPNLPEACFAVVLTPQCTPPRTFYRLRTWIQNAGFSFYWGAPQYGGNSAAQTYNFTAGGLGCLPADHYLLFIDAYPGCCPINVSYTGDQPLPVQLTNFHAVAGDGAVNLTWVTRSESGIERYEITRNGELLARVDGKGDDPSGHTYTYEDHSVVNGTTYSYTLTAYGTDGSAVVFPQAQSATPMSNIVSDYALNQNYPNPFNPTTAISYAVKDAGNVTLKVYSVDGRLVSTLVNAKQEAGKYTVNFDGSNLASGVYLYKIETNGFSATRKMVLMK